MKMARITLGITLCAVVLAGCTLKENYSVQYGFSNELATESTFTVSKGAIKVEAPFADFTCDQASIKATLSRKDTTLTMRLKGKETDERCSAKFFTNISGLESGQYVFRLIYDRGNGNDIQALLKDFIIQ